MGEQQRSNWTMDDLGQEAYAEVEAELDEARARIKTLEEEREEAEDEERAPQPDR